VERREVDALLQPRDDRLVDQVRPLEPLGAVHHAVADGVDVREPRDPRDPRLRVGHPVDDVRERRLVIAQRHRPPDRRAVAHLEGDDGLAANPLHQPLGQLPVGVLLDQVDVGLDDLELER
jgi:hypothetical protein